MVVGVKKDDTGGVVACRRIQILVVVVVRQERPGLGKNGVLTFFTLAGSVLVWVP
jgi:hypothetical protein